MMSKGKASVIKDACDLSQLRSQGSPPFPRPWEHNRQRLDELAEKVSELREEIADLRAELKEMVEGGDDE